MYIIESVKNSVINLKARKMRTFLTMLGLIIGIASVVIIMSVGAGAQSLILNQISSVGSDLVGVLPGASDEKGPPASVMGVTLTTLKLDDFQALLDRSNVSGVMAGAAYVTGISTVSWEGNKTDVNFSGTTASYPEVESADIGQGRFFSKEEEQTTARVIVLGSAVADDLFGNIDPINKLIKIKRETFLVIGIFKPRGTVFFQNQDNLVFIPITTAQKLLLGINHINYARFKVNAQENLEEVIGQIKMTLRERHNITDPADDDFSVRSTQQAIDVLTQVTDAIKFFLAAIASIALVVGGIGIMNIMLVSVSERIREIGLRKALGAKNYQLRNQFLLETIILSFSGGLIGIAVGVSVAALIALAARYLGYNWDLIISLKYISLACGVSIAVGLIFGMYPAIKASKYDPVEALRYE